jgi:FkbM family methyltransferase
MKLEDTLNGGYGGLYGEVVANDCYRIQELTFIPDLILDVGANIGIFARFARRIFPKATIVCVEPDPANRRIFREFTKDPNIFLLDVGLGSGQLYHPTTARNGSGEVYISAGLGYPKGQLEASGFEKPCVQSMRLHEMAKEYCGHGDRTMLKLDCEGAENSIWSHPMDMRALRTFDYIAGEIHFYSHTGEGLEEVRTKTLEALAELSETHTVELDNVHLWARKK